MKGANEPTARNSDCQFWKVASRRRGVSAFPTEAGLYLYLAEEGAELNGDVMLELEGELTGDLDLDAERGAVLVTPTAILGSREFDPSRLARARS